MDKPILVEKNEDGRYDVYINNHFLAEARDLDAAMTIVLGQVCTVIVKGANVSPTKIALIAGEASELKVPPEDIAEGLDEILKRRGLGDASA